MEETTRRRFAPLGYGEIYNLSNGNFGRFGVLLCATLVN